MDKGLTDKTESLRKKSNRLFKYQQSHKSELPVPPTPSQCRTKRVNNTTRRRKTLVESAHDNNRNLFECGITRNAGIVPIQGPSTSSNSDSLPSSVIHEQTDLLNVEISEQLTNISKMKDNFNNEVKEIMSLIENKGDVANAISKLCVLVQMSNDRMQSLHESTQQSLLKLLAVQKDLELSNERRDDIIKSNCDKIQMIETKMACSSDLHKLYITFTCDKELSELRKSRNLIDDARNIFKRMDIAVDELGILPIRSVHFQHIKVSNAVVPTLCITFINDRIAAIVRKKMMRFNARLDDENRLNELRYSERVFWSKDVWKLLKICWELKRLNLVNFVHVNADGIRVQYNTHVNENDSENKTATMIITCYSDIDKLRAIVGDIYSDISCTTLYGNNYFKLKFHERDAKRSNKNIDDSDDDEFDDASKMDC